MNEHEHKWIAYFDHEDATIYSTSVKLEGGHNDECGCAQFVLKENAQYYLIAQLEKFIEQLHVVEDDAKVRIAQIKESMKAEEALNSFRAGETK